MIAWIDGVMVTGSPEEIQRFREVAAKKKTNDFFKTPIDDVPEHVKNYGRNKVEYRYTGNRRMNAYF